MNNLYEKRCSKCGIVKDRSEFYSHSAHRDCISSRCKECSKERYSLRRSSIENLIAYRYSRMRNRCKDPNSKRASTYFGLDICSKGEFTEWAINDERLMSIYENWVESGFQLKLSPSIDRINPSIGYVLGNMQWLTQSDNTKKRSADRMRSICSAKGFDVRYYKVCVTCDTAKTRNNFMKDVRCYDGISIYCKSCRSLSRKRRKNEKQQLIKIKDALQR